MAGNDFIPNKLGFNSRKFMDTFAHHLNIALDRLSFSVQDCMRDEIMANGNGTKEMKATACAQVHEIDRRIDGDQVELTVGIEEDKLGGFSDQTFVRTAVVLHGNVTLGPLMTKPGKMTWKKNVTNYSLNPPLRKDGTPKTPRMMPKEFMQYEKVDGFGAKRKMLDNILEKRIRTAVKDFFRYLEMLNNSIDYSEFITVTGG